MNQAYEFVQDYNTNQMLFHPALPTAPMTHCNTTHTSCLFSNVVIPTPRRNKNQSAANGMRDKARVGPLTEFIETVRTPTGLRRAKQSKYTYLSEFLSPISQEADRTIAHALDQPTTVVINLNTKSSSKIESTLHSRIHVHETPIQVQEFLKQDPKNQSQDQIRIKHQKDSYKSSDTSYLQPNTVNSSLATNEPAQVGSVNSQPKTKFVDLKMYKKKRQSDHNKENVNNSNHAESPQSEYKPYQTTTAKQSASFVKPIVLSERVIEEVISPDEENYLELFQKYNDSIVASQAQPVSLLLPLDEVKELSQQYYMSECEMVASQAENPLLESLRAQLQRNLVQSDLSTIPKPTKNNSDFEKNGENLFASAYDDYQEDDSELQRFVLNDLKADIVGLQNRMSEVSKIFINVPEPEQVSVQKDAQVDELDLEDLKTYIRKLKDKIFAHHPFLSTQEESD